ncbi:hypothetical protein [Streptomyces sp. NPDC058855]|uniref:hypothetical protein n=1 Tax=Streptomyces sp. NPDC058855 TaxID=3346651 RepID=UPI003695D710
MSEQDSQAMHHPAVVAHRNSRAGDAQLRIADAITKFAGSMPFVYIHVIAFVLWMLFVEGSPWPTLTLVVSLEAIFLSTGRRPSSRSRPTTISSSRSWSSRPTPS